MRIKSVTLFIALSVVSMTATASTFSQMAALNSKRIARIDALHNKTTAQLKAKYGINVKSNPTYRKTSALSNSALIYNRLANSIKYNHGYAVNAVYKGYYPYTTRAIKGANYVSTAALARMKLAALKLKLGR